MPEPEIQADVREFLLAHVPSLEHLEVLLTLLGGQDRWWDAKLIGQQVGIPEARAGRVLDHFAAANLLDIRVTESVRYQLRGGTPTIDAMIQRLASLHRHEPAQLFRFAATLSRRSVTDFADAFRLRRR